MASETTACLLLLPHTSADLTGAVSPFMTVTDHLLSHSVCWIVIAAPLGMVACPADMPATEESSISPLSATNTSLVPTSTSTSEGLSTTGMEEVECGMAKYSECFGEFDQCPTSQICEVADEGSFICSPLCSFKDGVCPPATNSPIIPRCVSYQSSTVVGVCVLPCDEPQASLPTMCPEGTRCKHNDPDDKSQWFCANIEG